MRTLHVGLRVTDLERSLAFCTALGYEVLGDVPETEFGSLTMLKLPGDEFVTLELVHEPPQRRGRPGRPEPRCHPGGLHAGGRRRSHRPWCRGRCPHSPDGSEDFWTAWITDPDGYRIELVQWPAGHPVGMTDADFGEPGRTR
jgi:lactoylglutathione lyase